MNYSKHNSVALDIINHHWGTLSDHSQLQDEITREIATWVQSADHDLFKKIIMFLTNNLSTNLSKVCNLKVLSGSNLISKLSEKADNEFRLRTIFLQLLVEKNFPTSADQRKLLAATCSSLINHPNTEVRMWIIFSMSTLVTEKSTLAEINIERFFNDPAPKLRAAALEVWLTANKDSEEKDVVVQKILSVFMTNSSPFLHEELVTHLRAIAVRCIQDLIAACKQEHSNPTSLAKIKSKSKIKHKKALMKTKSHTEAVMVRLWRVLISLSEMSSLVSFVRQKASETEQAKRKAKKKITDELMLILPERKSFLEKSIQDFFDSLATTAVNDSVDQLDDAKEHEGGCLNGTRQRSLALAALNTLKSIPTQRTPELVRFGPGEQFAIALR